MVDLGVVDLGGEVEVGFLEWVDRWGVTCHTGNSKGSDQVEGLLRMAESKAATPINEKEGGLPEEVMSCETEGVLEI